MTVTIDLWTVVVMGGILAAILVLECILVPVIFFALQNRFPPRVVYAPAERYELAEAWDARQEGGG